MSSISEAFSTGSLSHNLTQQMPLTMADKSWWTSQRLAYKRQTQVKAINSGKEGKEGWQQKQNDVYKNTPASNQEPSKP